MPREAPVMEDRVSGSDMSRAARPIEYNRVMQTLRELDARFIKLSLGPIEENWPNGRPSIRYVDTWAEADGVYYLCPICFRSNSGPIGTHGVQCWFVGRVPDWVNPSPGRWNPSGTGIDDLTFVPPGQTSVQLVGGCNAHFNIVSGRVESA